MSERRTCYRCKKSGHIASNCPEMYNKRNQSRRLAQDVVRCYRCDCVGHMGRECSEFSGERTTCVSCFEPGHISRDCPNDYVEDSYGFGSGGASSLTCDNCNKIGHLSKDCEEIKDSDKNKEQDSPESSKETCGEPGHLSRECRKCNK